MDGQQQFLKPAQHVPFYVKRPITLDTSSHPHIFGYENGGKASSYSVDLSHSRFSRPRHMDQLSEPVIKTQSKSLRDVFEKAILNGEVAIHSPEEEPGVFRNPSFITASLPRPEKLNKLKQKSATIGGDNYLHLGIAHHRSTDNFVDSDSGSDTDPGRHNDAYLDDASSTISDELFKASSDGPEQLQPEEEFNIQPLPHLLDIDSHQAGRSTLGGFFKPKYRDYPHNNVHRTSERQHKEVIDCGTGRQSGKRGNSLHRQLPNSIHRDDSLRGYSTAFPTNGRDVGKLPRTRFPNATSPENYSSQSRDVDHSVEMSHNRYLPKKRRSSHSPRRHSPRLSSGQETAFNDLEDIVPASPELPRATSRHQSGEGRVDSDGAPLEQMEMEQPVWAKAEMREIRRRRRRRICCGLSALVFVIAIGTAIGVGLMIARNTDKNGDKVPPSLTPILISSTRSGESPSPKPTSSIYSTTTTEPPGIQNITLTFDGSMRITNLNFTNDLNDPESPRAQSLSTQFCDTMEDVFDPTVKNSDYTYQQCQVTNFTKGSVIVLFELTFHRSHTSNTSVDLIIVEAIKDNFGVFEVDNASISIIEKINQVSPTADTNLTSLPMTSSSLGLTTTTFQTPLTGCAAEGMIDNGQYPDDNCTLYRVCYDYGDEAIIRYFPCRGKKNMFVPTSDHIGHCEVCDPVRCPECGSTSREDITPESTTFIIVEETPLQTRVPPETPAHISTAGSLPPLPVTSSLATLIPLSSPDQVTSHTSARVIATPPALLHPRTLPHTPLSVRNTTTQVARPENTPTVVSTTQGTYPLTLAPPSSSPLQVTSYSTVTDRLNAAFSTIIKTPTTDSLSSSIPAAVITRMPVSATTTRAATTSGTSRISPTTLLDLCDNVQQDTVRAVPGDCTSFVYCYSNSSHVPVSCLCNQMFDGVNGCQQCDGSCDKCIPC
ncbi:mucin-17-like isoform X3 [Watersipora subatra]|uniref:mucin-17-like isoform X3 n=1 Tax=Watersipora subatra TaxID=2589382 RepID=UPI00355C7B1E